MGDRLACDQMFRTVTEYRKANAARQKYSSRTKNYGQVAEIILIAVNFI